MLELAIIGIFLLVGALLGYLVGFWYRRFTGNLEGVARANAVQIDSVERQTNEAIRRVKAETDFYKERCAVETEAFRQRGENNTKELREQLALQVAQAERMAEIASGKTKPASAVN